MPSWKHNKFSFYSNGIVVVIWNMIWLDFVFYLTYTAVDRILSCHVCERWCRALPCQSVSAAMPSNLTQQLYFSCSYRILIIKKKYAIDRGPIFFLVETNFWMDNFFYLARKKTIWIWWAVLWDTCGIYINSHWEMSIFFITKCEVSFFLDSCQIKPTYRRLIFNMPPNNSQLKAAACFPYSI